MNIIFVCTGNTCRSPMAEYYLKSKNLHELNISSRGFSSGEKANPNSVAVMAEMGIDISSHISRKITLEDIKSADVIICMSESHKNLLMSYTTTNTNIFVLGRGIPDPFGCDINTYRDCRNDIFSAIDVLIENNFFKQAKISVATVNDICAIAKIEEQSFSTPWSNKAIEESMNCGTCFYVAQIDSNIVGYMGISKISGEGYVTNIAVLPEYRRRGIGKQILDYVISTCANELEFISLEVRTSNDAAISLYEYFGFERVGLRKRFYTHPQEDALVMTKKFI